MSEQPEQDKPLEEEIADAIFADLMSGMASDEEMKNLARAMNVGLSVNDEEEDQRYQPVEGDVIGYTDVDGDIWQGRYHETDCPNHGPEPWVVFVINEREAVRFPFFAIPSLVEHLERWHEKALEVREPYGDIDG